MVKSGVKRGTKMKMRRRNIDKKVNIEEKERRKCEQNLIEER